MHALIVGCGYLGQRVAARWLAAGHAVSALTRSSARADAWRRDGLTPLIGDVLSPRSLTSLPACDVVLYAVGYDRTAGVDKRAVYVEGLRNVLDAVAERTQRLIYISSSSVYGQDAGEWVDEASPTEPKTEGGRICLQAEGVLRSSPLAAAGRAVILRLTGIYGPDRLLTRVESLRQGTPLAGSPEAWLNLIHVDDAASAVVAAAAHSSREQVAGTLPASVVGTAHSTEVYLVTDDRPVTRGEYYSELARLVGAPRPSFDATQTPRHGTGLNKQCRSRHVKQNLVTAWRYPTIAEGLLASLNSSG